MRTSSHRKFLAIFLVSSVLAIVTLGFLTYIGGPRVRLVTPSFDPKADSYTLNEAVVFSFDRPIKQQDYSDQISIEPKVKFSAKTNKQQISIRFEENLKSDTDYKINLKQGSVKSSTGTEMKRTFGYELRTMPLSYVYIKRDFKDGKDQVVKSDIKDKETVIYESQEIRHLVASRDKIVIVEYLEDSKNDRFVLIDRHTNAREYVDPTEINNGYAVMPTGSLIKKISASPRGDLVVFTGASSGASLNRYDDSLYSYNTKTGDFEIFYESEADSSRLKASDFRLSDDGQIIAFANYDLTYQIISAHNDSLPESLGRFDQTGGFNKLGSKILFSASNEVVYYDAIEQKESVLAKDVPFFAAGFKSNSDSIYIVEHELPIVSSEHRLVEYDSNKTRKIWSTEFDYLTRASLSYDDSHYAVETSSYSCSYDKVEFNPQCIGSTLSLINADSLKLNSKKGGFNLVWLP